MAYEILRNEFPVLSREILDIWCSIPPSIASDCLNRRFSMCSSINPISAGSRICGQARTFSVMAGDNSMLHIGLQHVRAGEIVVVDGAGLRDVAVWGEVLTTAAIARGVGGVVIDGSTRDSAAIRRLGFPLFCAGIVPRGPHKGFGGTMDDTIAVGGTAVGPGDLVLGDDDGVVVVPLELEAQTRSDSEKRMRDEDRWMEQIRNGESTATLFGLPTPAFVER